jgi:hypothetical protein
MASGVLPDYSTDPPIGGLPGKDIWMGMKLPLFLIAGQADHITPADNLKKIARWLGREDEVKGCNDLKVETGMCCIPSLVSNALFQALVARNYHRSLSKAVDCSQ